MQAPEQLYLPFSSPDWLYELKFDGYRCMAAVDGGQVQLRTKAGRDCTKWYPEVVQALLQLPGGPHVIDGEACVLRPDGTSDFNLLQERARKRRGYPGAPPVTLTAFDILVHDGRLTMNMPLVERKALLQQLLASVPKVRPAAERRPAGRGAADRQEHHPQRGGRGQVPDPDLHRSAHPLRGHQGRCCVSRRLSRACNDSRLGAGGARWLLQQVQPGACKRWPCGLDKHGARFLRELLDVRLVEQRAGGAPVLSCRVRSAFININSLLNSSASGMSKCSSEASNSLTSSKSSVA
jgi:hypothetical protein